tara:strand:- start:30774 stop:30980 length:207 start_codon:yes stop_codon:yes gene_type:complete
MLYQPLFFSTKVKLIQNIISFQLVRHTQITATNTLIWPLFLFKRSIFIPKKSGGNLNVVLFFEKHPFF